MYATGQVEIGNETNKEHLQFVICFATNWRLNRLKKIWPTAHFERCYDVTSAMAYCNKEETRARGPWSFGVDPETRQKSNWIITVRNAAEKTEDELQELSV